MRASTIAISWLRCQVTCSELCVGSTMLSKKNPQQKRLRCDAPNTVASHWLLPYSIIQREMNIRRRRCQRREWQQHETSYVNLDVRATLQYGRSHLFFTIFRGTQTHIAHSVICSIQPPLSRPNESKFMHIMFSCWFGQKHVRHSHHSEPDRLRSHFMQHRTICASACVCLSVVSFIIIFFTAMRSALVYRRHDVVVSLG